MTETTDRHEPASLSRIRAARHLVAAGAARYDPDRHLERLFPEEVFASGKATATAGAARLARLKRALRTERRKGRAGHWSYDLNRHIGLLQAVKAELSGLDGPVRAGRKGD
ncbi:hypothetical protein HW532_04350 [Kaustia mangrovi]|uniref:Uncharacterized protein n=1 Tax=Kaustia mangrovi TaxID=2593653 RepID=A0A7S8HAB5_9HYPH|nr:DUF6477 family protein [Kaustia mangrovi]QPC41264.1 hypothetical protein HW532_04350 [Kaustia mangrovi]